MNEFKLQCIELRKQDYTLPEIMKMTGRSKTSVYFHIKDIPLSEKKQKHIALNNKKRAQEIAALRKGKSLRSFVAFSTWTPDLILLVAHLLFDGELSKSCIYNNRSRALIRRVEKLMQHVYEYQPKQYQNPKTGVYRISYHNVALAGFLSGKGKLLIRDISKFPRESKRAFLRAFFDDEGCMDYRPTRSLRQIRGYQNDQKILRVVLLLLASLEITASLKGRNEVVITGKENLLRFRKEINFSKGVRINGKRSNSLWKQSLEKKELLDRAIKSFKY